MTALTTQHVVAAGTAPNFALQAATTSDTAEIGNGHNTFVVYKNTDTVSKTITIVSDLVLDSGADYPDRTYTLAANTGELWIPLIKDYEDDAAGAGRATLAIDNITGVTVAVVRRS